MYLDPGSNITRRTHRERVQLVEVALDTRPTVPFLVREELSMCVLSATNCCVLYLQPNPEGIGCLVLSGYVTGGSTPKPGKIRPLPLVRRLDVSDLYAQ